MVKYQSYQRLPVQSLLLHLLSGQIPERTMVDGGTDCLSLQSSGQELPP